MNTTTTLFPHVIGQYPTKRKFDFYIKAFEKTGIVPNIMLTAPKGAGKTMLARAFARNLVMPSTMEPKRFLELNCATIKNLKHFAEMILIPHLQNADVTVLFDECHMLTEAAANAALKLFEEPPEHIILILCTTGQTNNPETKVAKAFNTLASRCMKFQFAAVDVEDILAKLRYVCKQEDRNVEDDILRGIARKAHGSVRDAESLLDSALTFSDAPVVRINDVRWLISEEEDKALELLESLCSTRPFESILLVSKCYEEGFNLFAIARSCAELATEALQISLDVESFYSDSQKKRLFETAKLVDTTYLLDIIRSLGQIKSSSFSDGKQDLEIVLADLAYSVSSQPSAAW